MTADEVAARASELLTRWRGELLRAARLGPVLDVACGDGRNGLALALAPALTAPADSQAPWVPEVLLVDRSADAIGNLLHPEAQPGGAMPRTNASGQEPSPQSGLPQNAAFRLMDLETPEPPSLGVDTFGVVLMFRYLHRPLIPVLRACLAPGGMLVCETYLEGQQAYGKPRNPDHLLRRGELAAWFGDWEVLELYEGELTAPLRIMGRVVCRKPGLSG